MADILQLLVFAFGKGPVTHKWMRCLYAIKNLEQNFRLCRHSLFLFYALIDNQRLIRSIINSFYFLLATAKSLGVTTVMVLRSFLLFFSSLIYVRVCCNWDTVIAWVSSLFCLVFSWKPSRNDTTLRCLYCVLKLSLFEFVMRVPLSQNPGWSIVSVKHRCRLNRHESKRMISAWIFHRGHPRVFLWTKRFVK